MNKPTANKKRGRPRKYSAAVVGALRVAWEATDRLCSKRLRLFLPELIKVLRRHGETTMSAEVAAQLCQMSPATIDRLLRPWRRLGGRRPFSTTKPGTLLKSAIPIRTFADWEENRPGFLEADLMPRLAYKLGVRKPFLWVTSIVEAVLALVAIRVGLSMSWLLMVLVGAADNTRLVFTLALPVELMPEEEVGTASGLILSIGFIGAIIGPLIGGRILDLTGSLDISLIVLAGVSLAAAGVALRLPETGIKPGDRK